MTKTELIKLQFMCGKPTPLGVGWIAHFNQIKKNKYMCIKQLTTYTYYDILYIWKTNIDIRIQQSV